MIQRTGKTMTLKLDNDPYFEIFKMGRGQPIRAADVRENK